MTKNLLLILIISLLGCSESKDFNKSFSKDEAEKFAKNLEHFKTAKIYSDSAIIVLNNEPKGYVNAEVGKKHIEFLEKSLAEAKQVDSSLLNKAIKNEGTIYYEKYIKGIQFQIEGAKNADAQKSLKGQQLYGEYAEYMEKNIR